MKRRVPWQDRQNASSWASQLYRCKEPTAAYRCQGSGALQTEGTELTARTRGISIEQMTKELTSYLRGWKGYFGFCETPSVLERLDQWIRHRLRSIIWKQWKRGRLRFARLCARGLRKNLAAQTPGSDHGPWRLAHSPAMQYAFPNAYFDSLGLPRLFAGK
jgi:RNA-directed DNA polymerase